MRVPTDCKREECMDRRKKGFLYCAEHLKAEHDQWAADNQKENGR